jgi:nucleoside-diphosphate-sugar epimerase
MKQSILVLGANGFIGREVVAALESTDWATPVLGVRNPSESTRDSFEQRAVDATDVKSISQALQGVAGAVNCVAGDENTLVRAASALCEAAVDMTPPPRIVHLSTMSVYGSTTGLVDESATLRGDIGPYSVAKIAAEASMATYPHAVIFRPGCVFGPRSEQWSVRMARLLLARRLGDLGAAGDGYCNLVHVADVAEAVARALKDGQVAGSVFNLSSPEPPTWNEFLIRYATALRAVPVRRISRRRLKIEAKLLAPPLKIAEILGRACKLDVRPLPPPIPPSLLRLMSQEIRLDTRRVESALGLRWRDLDATLAESARQFVSP